MDMIELVAHELTEHALENHRNAAGVVLPVPRADMTKLARVMLPLTLQREDRRVQNSMAIIVEVKRRVSAMPLNSFSEAMVLLALKNVIQSIFPHAGLGW